MRTKKNVSQYYYTVLTSLFSWALAFEQNDDSVDVVIYIVQKNRTIVAFHVDRFLIENREKYFKNVVSQMFQKHSIGSGFTVYCWCQHLFHRTLLYAKGMFIMVRTCVRSSSQFKRKHQTGNIRRAIMHLQYYIRTHTYVVFFSFALTILRFF